MRRHSRPRGIAAQVALGLALGTTVATPAEGQIVNTGVVKTSSSGFACVVIQGTTSCNAGAVNWLIPQIAPVFTPSGSHTPTPGVPNPPHTANPLILPIGEGLKDFNGDGFSDVFWRWTTKSLADIGTYFYRIDCTWSNDGGQTIHMCTSATLSLVITNSAPTAAITRSGTRAIHDSLTFNANSSDPDGGAVAHSWRFISPTPAGHAATFATPGAASTTLAFVDERDIGDWTVALDVDDNEGERKTFSTATFTIPNLPPDIAITGVTAIDVGQKIELAASTTTDPDGGPPLQLSWDLISAPQGASRTAPSNVGTAANISIQTTSADVGKWRFGLTARDNDNAPNSTDVAEVEVTVRNQLPKITLSSASSFRIEAGQAISVSNTTPNDPDGGTVTHRWELVQAPVTAAEAPRASFQTGQTLSLLSPAAGTWIFDLHVTDDENNKQADGSTADIHQELKVLVNGPPTAVITGPSTIGFLTYFEIDGSGSTDADTPPTTAANRGHVTSRPPADVSDPPIERYHWTLVDVPPDQFPRYTPGPVEYSLHLSNGTAKLAVVANALRAGTWTFELEVTDAEGGTDHTSYSVDVLDPNSRPFAVFARPVTYALTDVNGVALSPVVADGSFSFDFDNLITSNYVPGLGITDYTWQLTAAPATCTSLPTPPAASNATSFQLYPAGAVIPLACQGIWGAGLTVTDDDAPALQGRNETVVVIYNCPGEVCIDYPTEANYKYVELVDQTDVTVYYHVNSAVYQLTYLASGLRMELALFHESDLTTPAYVGQFDYDILALATGGTPAAHWHGFTTAGARPRPGKYTVRMRAANPKLPTPFAEAIQTNAIWLEVVDVTIGAGSDGTLALNNAASLGDRLHVSYSATAHFTAGAVYDEAILHIRPAASPSTEVAAIQIPQPTSGVVDWDGVKPDGTQLAPGQYTAEIEVLKAGRSLGTSAKHPFTAYKIGMTVAGMLPAQQRSPGVTLPIGGPAKTVTVTLAAAGLAGSVVLHTTNDAGVFEVRDGANVLATGTGTGVTFPVSAFATPKTLTVKALKGSQDPTRFDATFVPNGVTAPAKQDDAYATLRGLDARVDVACADAQVAATKGIFVQRNPAAVNFGQHRFLMQPLSVIAQPAMGATSDVSLEVESGNSAAIALHEAGGAHAIVALPHTWHAADFDATTHKLEVKLMASGAGYGEVVLRLRYKADGTEIATTRVKLRVADLPGLAGVTTSGYPFFIYGRVVNEGTPINVALDPGRFPERVGRKAAVYVVPHRTPSAWAANNSLAGAIGGPTSVTIATGSVAANATAVGTPPAPGPGSPVEYDVVYDFGNCPDDPATFATDGTLDPGDLIDSITPMEPSVSIVPSLVALGPGTTTTVDYSVPGGGVGSRTFVLKNYDGNKTDFGFRLKGRLVYPSGLPVGTKRSLIVLAHGNHLPKTVNFPSPGTAIPATVTSDENYLGFGYLQDHLARAGYITLSVDLDELNGVALWAVGPEIDPNLGVRLRAHMILHNIEEVLANAAVAPNIDKGSIYLIGHSRSGNAVLLAKAFLSGSIPRPNSAPGVQSPAYSLLPSAIKGIVSLSPVSVELAPATVPFLLIYGSADGDVEGASSDIAWPFRHYDRAPGPAHLIYAIGANHNFFNSSWPFSEATHDVELVAGVIAPVARPPFAWVGLLNAAQQRDVAKAYILAFLKLYEEQRAAYASYFLLAPSRLRPAGLDPSVPLSVATRLAPGSTREVVDDYETQTAKIKASSGAKVSFTLSDVLETDLADRDLADEGNAANRFFQETRGVLFSWQGTSAEYRFDPVGTPLNLHASRIALRVGQQPYAVGPATGTPLTFAVTLIDKNGDSSQVSIEAWSPVRGVYASKITNWLAPGLPDPDPLDTTKGVLQTVAIPSWAFISAGRTLDLGQIVAIRVDVGDTGLSIEGTLAVDDVEIWR
ncbi:MAG: hypothetical protein AABO58_12715 [Acidobacteriota bacterium]